jgi:hypothetical protein
VSTKFGQGRRVLVDPVHSIFENAWFVEKGQFGKSGRSAGHVVGRLHGQNELMRKVPGEASFSARINLVGLWLAAAVAAALVITHLINAWALDRDVGILDAGSGGSVLERVGTVAIALAAANAAVWALWRESVVPHGVVAVLLTLVCIDDALGLHEDLGGWKLAYLPILGAVFILLWMHASSHTGAGFLIHLGLVLLAFSFVYGELAERTSTRYNWERGDVGYELKIVGKDATEVAGWVLIASGLTATTVSVRR